MLDKYRYSWYNKSVKDIVFFAAVVELADTRDLKSRGSNPVPVQVRSAAPRRNGLRSIPIFLCRKISHMLRHSSSFAKRHARLICSLASALTTAHCRYHLFASVPAAQTSLWFATSEWTSLHSDFSLQKNQSYAPSFLLFRKKARSARLFACKRAHYGSLSLSPFCECACGT